MSRRNATVKKHYTMHIESAIKLMVCAFLSQVLIQHTVVWSFTHSNGLFVAQKMLQFLHTYLWNILEWRSCFDLQEVTYQGKRSCWRNRYSFVRYLCRFYESLFQEYLLHMLWSLLITSEFYIMWSYLLTGWRKEEDESNRKSWCSSRSIHGCVEIGKGSAVKSLCKPFIGLVSVQIPAWTQLASILGEFERTSHDC